LIIRQSDLSSWSRCPQQKHLTNEQRAGRLSQAPEQLSPTAFGSVVHHAVRVLEEWHHFGRPDPLGHAKATFEYYWDQSNIHVICPPVTIWTPRETWAGLLRKGLAIIETYWEHLQRDTGKLLGLEVEFNLPYVLDDEEHTIHGTMDRLSLRRAGRAYLNIEDFKTGQEYIGLRWNVQFTVYSWATTQAAFWDAWGDESTSLNARFNGMPALPRRGTWISLRGGVKRHDAGYRAELDYRRMDVALREYVRSNRAGIFPLILTGSVCRFCQFREGICGGVPVPEEDYGS
jgi:hypothetical protein